MRRLIKRVLLTPPASFDADASAYLIAAGITDSTQMSAINTLVVSLKNNGLWSPMIALYPFVGGSASAHKFNLKDPRDVDAAFRLSFVGGWTHSSTGALPNGTNGYADTFYNPVSQSLSTSSAHLSIYQRQTCDAGTTRNHMGAETAAATNGIQLLWGNTGSAERGQIGGAASNEYAPSSGSTAIAGLMSIATNGDRNAQYYYNGSARGTAILQTGSLPNFSIYIAASNRSGTAINFLNKEIAFATIGTGLSSSQMSILYTIIQTFQTTLNRNV